MNVFLYASIFLIITSCFCLYRGIKGPTVFDRILAVNVIGTKTTVIIVLVGHFFNTPSLYTDIAIVYTLLNFMSTIVISRYLENLRRDAAIDG